MLARWMPAMLLLAACQEEARFITPERTESFVAGTRREPTDVLFVMDDSASMAEEQERLVADVDAMLDITEDAEADVRFGVVTTDAQAGAAGQLRGGLLEPGPGLSIQLGIALEVGIDGSRDEQGFSSAVLAIDGRNEGFPRKGARFELIFFSDEDDQSPGAYEPWFDALWEVFDLRMRAHGVIGDLPDGCFSPEGAADAGSRYVRLVEQTLGYQESICAPDYRGILERLGLDIAGIQDTFPLERIPSPSTIVVEVNGVVVVEDAEAGWTYEPGPNAIVFHGSGIPEPGAEVSVVYIELRGAAPASEEGELGAGGS